MHPAIWTKMGRSSAENHQLQKASALKQIVRTALVKQGKSETAVDTQLFARTRDYSVVYDSMKLARYEGGKERVDWKKLTELTHLSQAQILENLVALDEQP
eukprot:2876758-Amphidinium_carterae.1